MQPRVGLSDDERAEYAELGAAYRNDDNIGLAVGALLIPFAFAAIAAVWQLPQLLVPLSVASGAAFVIYAMYSARLGGYRAIRLARIRQLEDKGKLRHHTAIDRAVRTGAIPRPTIGGLQYASGCLWGGSWFVTTVLVAAHQLPWGK